MVGLPYQWPVDDVPRAAATNYPVVAPLPYNNGPVVRLPEGMVQNLLPVGVLNGQVVYRLVADVFAPSDSAAPPPNASMSKKSKRGNQQDEDRPYIKKPPNAFMLFMKEQRPNVVAELNISKSAAVNTVLGQRWKSLSIEEQARYYEEARKQRLLHSQRHPNWSSSDNYGKKQKRKRSKVPTSVEASASKPGEVTQQAKKLCVTPVQTAVMEPSTSQAGVMEPSTSQTGVMEPSTSQTGVMEAPHTQTVQMGPPHAQTAVTLPVYDICHLQQVHERWSPPLHQRKHKRQSPTMWSLMMEQLEPLRLTVQPQLPSSPCTNIWTVDADQINM